MEAVWMRCRLGMFVGVLVACGGSSTSPDAARSSDMGRALDASRGECLQTSAAGLRNCVDPERYRTDVEFVAQPRLPGSAHWQAVQDRCAATFTELGLTVERHAYETGVNILGTRAGDGTGPAVVVSAHYDHIADCAGADDNATGVAAVLELARVFSGANHAGTLVFACWDEEERGLLGSKAYAARIATEGRRIDAMVGFDTIGFRNTTPNSQTLPTNFEAFFPAQTEQARANRFRADFVGLVYDQAAASLWSKVGKHATAVGLLLLQIVVPSELKRSTLAAELRRSDHASFWDADVPAMMVSDTADLRNPHYHCRGGPDSVADLDFDFAVKVVRAFAGTLAEMVVVR